MLGDVPLKALIIADHAVPNATLFSPGLAERGGDDSTDRFVDTALTSVLENNQNSLPGGGESDAARSSSEPLQVDEFEGSVFIKGVGSEAKVVEADIKACGSVVHLIDHVLLPIDGDSELEPFQKERIEMIKKRGEAMKKEEETEDTDDDQVEASYGDVLADAPAPAK